MNYYNILFLSLLARVNFSLLLIKTNQAFCRHLIPFDIKINFSKQDNMQRKSFSCVGLSPIFFACLVTISKINSSCSTFLTILQHFFNILFYIFIKYDEVIRFCEYDIFYFIVNSILHSFS